MNPRPVKIYWPRSVLAVHRFWAKETAGAKHTMPSINAAVLMDKCSPLFRCWVSHFHLAPNGGVDRATALPSTFAGSRLMRNSLPVAPVQTIRWKSV
jgi:hypothetical protein